MNKLYLKENFYCTLHLRKNGIAVSNESPVLNIMRNSDQKYLKPSTSNWNIAPDDISMTEITGTGIYQYMINIADFNNSVESYTLIYKVEINGQILIQSEQLYVERKNRAGLV